MKRPREPEEDSSSEYSSTEAPSVVDVDDDHDAPTTRSKKSQPSAKIIQVDESAADDSSTVVMRCLLPPHREALAFRSYTDYETHYHKAHSNRCFECRKNFPSDHLLSVHIEEQHDAFAAVLREKGEHTYSCFVEGCDRKCRTPQKRRMHLIDKHMYPKNFFFGVTKDGIDGRSSLLIESAGHRRRGSSISQNGGQKAAARRHSLRSQTAEAAAADTTTHAAAAPEVEAKGSMASSNDKDTPRPESADTAMADLESAMSALQFVPPSIRFGRGKGKSGFAKK
ncbi:c2h2 type zinc finger protein [Apiospora arundinis]|uniref:C2h2 type zinc finger protein n=1 Tax=Apiospora arundinis TaxID=335852 RepID=A0ABR2J4H2_9PEZI